MIISEHWLREWVNPKLTTDELASQLTMAGLEVDAVAPVAGDFSGVVVAEIIEAEQHPDADKLRVCTVNTGDGTVQIVCGAPNARAGLKAPLATVGAVLPGNFKIKKAKLRGVESQGMLCAEAELTISDENSGLMELSPDAPVGTNLRDYLALNDTTLELGLTPNRADCLGVIGVARDLAALNGISLCEPAEEPADVTSDREFPVEVKSTEKCPRYLGRVIENVDLTKSSPLYIVERLRRAGIRSIDPVVDITNYVMLELGQPLHAFDLDTLDSGIVVRDAHPGERMVLLDGSEIELSEGTLVIADHERPLALAGIMGGENSGVSEKTKHIFLESAFFAPRQIAGRARGYGLHTDASHRYERGVDWQLQRRAIERASQLLVEVVGGQCGPVVEAVSEHDLPDIPDLTLRAARIKRVLGFDMAPDEAERILTGLGFSVSSTSEGVWSCRAPSWRFDMSQEVDLIEELARIHGYNNLPVSQIHADLVSKLPDEGLLSKRHLRQRLVGRGFQEAITFSFVSPDLQTLFGAESQESVAVKNPISADLSVMRSTLMPGLTLALAHNVKRQNSRVRLFETGSRFSLGEPYREQAVLGLAITGTRDGENWTEAGERLDFFDLKGEVEQLLGGPFRSISFRAVQRSGLHDGQTAEVLVDDEVVGIIGCIHPSVARHLDVPADTFLAELMLAEVLSGQVPSYQDISKFPETRRDIAVVVNVDQSADAIMSDVRAVAGACLVDLRLFDVYQGNGIEPDQKSLALGLTFRDNSRTLDDTDITQLMTQVVDSLKKKFDAALRN